MMCGEKWLETGNPFVEGDMGESQIEWYKAENERLTKRVEQLMKDVHRIDCARQSTASQCAAMAEEVDRMNNLLFAASQENLRLKTWCASFDDGAIGERGHACLSIDGGNL